MENGEIVSRKAGKGGGANADFVEALHGCAELKLVPKTLKF